MNRSTIILIAVVIVIAGCSRHGIKGDGVIKAEDRPISGFSKVVVAGGYEVQWSSGKPALNITADENLLPLINTVVNGDTLQIDSKEDLAPTKSIVIILSSASLADVELTGGISFKASQISGHDLKLASTGSADISVDGSVTNLEANFTGAGRLDAKSLEAQTARLSLVGSSDANVTVTGTLNATVTGACTVNYSGDPKFVEQHVTGSGGVWRRP